MCFMQINNFCCYFRTNSIARFTDFAGGNQVLYEWIYNSFNVRRTKWRSVQISSKF